ncbi:hypothetical protein [Nocardia terpenica]|uniref:Uncharacterized protein n=1 Tax=Nocardia terpenica TaxID=455432 RepID=A0A164H2T6_9NOCA|nr:hypothetical protein [Nocardia terpenica]KZM68151.1 hypothetical protein AWN90_09425 [Nocardia terpenica]NQE88989.1 hypothetical protein [Nocardia terpenica]
MSDDLDPLMNASPADLARTAFMGILMAGMVAVGPEFKAPEPLPGLKAAIVEATAATIKLAAMLGASQGELEDAMNKIICKFVETQGK